MTRLTFISQTGQATQNSMLQRQNQICFQTLFTHGRNRDSDKLQVHFSQVRRDTIHNKD